MSTPGAHFFSSIHLLSQTKCYAVVSLAALFSTFVLIVHYVVGTESSVEELQETVVFGMWALLPYFSCLMALYLR